MADVYLRRLRLPSDEAEREWLFQFSASYKASHPDFSNVYPFGVLARFRGRRPPQPEFAPVTIFCGGNGCGKSTLLNVIASCLGLERRAPFNTTDFFQEYCDLCELEYTEIPPGSRIITSDDIFDMLLEKREQNARIDAQRAQTQERAAQMQRDVLTDSSHLRMHGMEDYARFKEYCGAVYQPTAKYLRERTQRNLETESNGETAIRYLMGEIRKNALYLLDEPENSLSPQLQLELNRYIEDAARFFHCQFILATHSPLLLSIYGARVYDLDDPEGRVRPWTELEGVQTWYEFFRSHAAELEPKPF